MNKYAEFLTMVSTEFHRYLMENQKFTDKIPANALIIFQVEGEEGFNNWHKETSLKNRETDQPVIYIYVKKWMNRSSIEELSMTGVA
ncbi:MAG: hypothetical protein E3K37_14585 [Candidatus Kuenenia sp.]|nr:hypothetical protein [Candidatus Kuenenia hertensis]